MKIYNENDQQIYVAPFVYGGRIVSQPIPSKRFYQYDDSNDNNYGFGTIVITDNVASLELTEKEQNAINLSWVTPEQLQNQNIDSRPLRFGFRIVISGTLIEVEPYASAVLRPELQLSPRVRFDNGSSIFHQYIGYFDVLDGFTLDENNKVVSAQVDGVDVWPNLIVDQLLDAEIVDGKIILKQD